MQLLPQSPSLTEARPSSNLLPKALLLSARLHTPIAVSLLILGDPHHHLLSDVRGFHSSSCSHSSPLLCIALPFVRSHDTIMIIRNRAQEESHSFSFFALAVFLLILSIDGANAGKTGPKPIAGARGSGSSQSEHHTTPPGSHSPQLQAASTLAHSAGTQQHQQHQHVGQSNSSSGSHNRNPSPSRTELPSSLRPQKQPLSGPKPGLVRRPSQSELGHTTPGSTAKHEHESPRQGTSMPAKFPHPELPLHSPSPPRFRPSAGSGKQPGPLKMSSHPSPFVEHWLETGNVLAKSPHESVPLLKAKASTPSAVPAGKMGFFKRLLPGKNKASPSDKESALAGSPPKPGAGKQLHSLSKQGTYPSPSGSNASTQGGGVPKPTSAAGSHPSRPLTIPSEEDRPSGSVKGVPVTRWKHPVTNKLYDPPSQEQIWQMKKAGHALTRSESGTFLSFSGRMIWDPRLRVQRDEHGELYHKPPPPPPPSSSGGGSVRSVGH